MIKNDRTGIHKAKNERKAKGRNKKEAKEVIANM